jgi:sigma-E factor negative regulatory protein RseA
MKQQISVLMDGEMFEDEAAVLLDRLKRHPEADREWTTYHLIGDALRQPEHVSRDFMAAFHDRLESEPTILAPKRRQQQRIKQYAMSAAASVMALALVAWLSMQVGQEPAPQMASIQQQNMVQPVAFHPSDYLMAHQEFSPSADVQGAATYIHSVAAR